MKKLINIFWNKRLHIIVILMVSIIIGAIYSFYFTTPEYKAATKVAFVKAGEDKTVKIEDVDLIEKMIGTYTSLVTSKPVLRTAINNLQINETEATLSKKITISQEKNTKMLQIEVRDENPVKAMKTANEITNVFSAKADEMFGCKVYVLEEAEQSITPYNINHVRDIAIFMLIGLVVAIIYVIISSMFDVTIKDIDDVENGTELTTLISIPFVNDDKQKGGNN